MITKLFNQHFTIQRNYPEFKDGIIEDHYVEIGRVYGRISSPQAIEKNTYQNRGLILSAMIYLDVYDYDEQRDMIIEAATGTKYKISGLTAFRNEVGTVAFLKIPVIENQFIDAQTSGSESAS